MFFEQPSCRRGALIRRVMTQEHVGLDWFLGSPEGALEDTANKIPQDETTGYYWFARASDFELGMCGALNLRLSVTNGLMMMQWIGF